MEKADAEQFKTAYDAARTPDERWELIKTTREKFLEAKTEIARRAFGPLNAKRRGILSALYHRPDRQGRRPYEAWARLPGGKWRSKSFRTEEEARQWVQTCLSAISKVALAETKKKAQENNEKRAESDYADAVTRFNNDVYNSAPVLVAKRAPFRPPATKSIYEFDLA